MPIPELRAVTAFRIAFARRQAARAVDVPGGFAVLDDEFHRSHEQNQLIVAGQGTDPESVRDAAEATLGRLSHRRISVLDDELGRACVPVLERSGYEHSAQVVMVHTGPTEVAAGAEPIDLDTLRPALQRQLRIWRPDSDDELTRHLVERYAARARGAEQLLILAARDTDGEIGSWADLYLGPTAGTAQIEALITAEGHTRRGLADAVLATGLHRAAQAGCGLRFLVADADDWPQHWYARRGFSPVGYSHTFTRF